MIELLISGDMTAEGIDVDNVFTPPYSLSGIAVLEMENVRRPDGVSPSTRTLYTPSRTPGIVKGKLFLCRLVSSVTWSNFPVVELYFSMLTMYSGPSGLNDGTSMETVPENIQTSNRT